MRYPNLRYGNAAEFAFYATGIPLPELALLMRLQRMEAELRHRHMFSREPDKTPCTNRPPLPHP